MSERLVWFLVGAGAVYLLCHRRGAVGGAAGFNLSFDGQFGGTGASTPDDLQWANPNPAVSDVQGVWDPMGTPTWYKLQQSGTNGNGVMTGGGINP